MIAALIFLLAAQVEAAAPVGTSLYLRCKVSAPGEAIGHEVDLTYFDPVPSWAMGLNFRDPDGLLPKKSRPMIAESWPTGVLIEFQDSTTSGTRTGAVAIMPTSDNPSRALIRIESTSTSEPALRRFAGECSVVQGADAEREYQELFKK